MSKIHILADTSCDMPNSQAKEYNIRLLPFKLNFEDGNEYRDRVDIEPAELYKKLRETNTIPKTVQITPTEFEEIFREEVQQGYDEIVVVTIASTASGTYQSAMIAKTAVEEEGIIKVHVVDSMNLSYGTGFAILQGAKALQSGADGQTIASVIKDTVDSSTSYFSVETLEYLKRGGRIKTATAVIGGMLDIRPILTVKNGVVESLDKVRGSKKVAPKLVSLVKEKIEDVNDCTIILLSGDADEIISAISAELKEQIGRNEDMLLEVGATIGAHAGPGVHGICVFPKKY